MIRKATRHQQLPQQPKVKAARSSKRKLKAAIAMGGHEPPSHTAWKLINGLSPE